MEVTTKQGRSATRARSGPVNARPGPRAGLLHALRRLSLGLTLVRNQRPQLLAGLEHRDRTRGHFDRIAGARVASHAGLAAADLEGPETADLDVVLLLEGVLDRLEERVHIPRAIFLGDHRTSALGIRGGYLFDEIVRGHRSPRRVAGGGAGRPP